MGNTENICCGNRFETKGSGFEVLPQSWGKLYIQLSIWYDCYNVHSRVTKNCSDSALWYCNHIKLPTTDAKRELLVPNITRNPYMCRFQAVNCILKTVRDCFQTHLGF